MIVYGSSLSPFVRKTLAYISEKGLTAEVKMVVPHDQSAEFCEVSPFGKIPGFRDGDFTISDSTAIITYLEASHPAPVLVPTDPRARARVAWYDEFADTILAPAIAKVFFNRIVAPLMGQAGDLATADTAAASEVPTVIDYVESRIPASGFLVGDGLTLADISVASPFVNLAHAGEALDAARHPKTATWVASILGRPSFAALITQETRFLAR